LEVRPSVEDKSLKELVAVGNEVVEGRDRKDHGMWEGAFVGEPGDGESRKVLGKDRTASEEKMGGGLKRDL
jgi:hypothetical protein